VLASRLAGRALSAELGLPIGGFARYAAQLPPERHVIELVRPPYSGAYIINGTSFTAGLGGVRGLECRRTDNPVGGRLHGRCVGAVFYNVARHRACQMWCG